MEAQLYETGKFPFTSEWYEGREHAPHREQLPHQDRMRVAAELVTEAVREFGVCSVVDLGAGDGGLLQMVREHCEGFLPADRFHGYDLMEPNVMYGRMVRKVDVRLGDFLTEDIEWGHLTLITECLEHLEHPYDVVRMIADHSDFIVASSPASETVENHTEEHAFCWDEEGYAHLLQTCGYKLIIEHRTVDNGDMTFQVVLARKPG